MIQSSCSAQSPDHDQPSPKPATSWQRCYTTLWDTIRTGADIDLDLVQARGAPEGLKHRTILVLKRQESKTIRNDYWAFIMKTLEAMPDYR